MDSLTGILLNIERFLPTITIVLVTLITAFLTRWTLQRYLSKITNRARIFADLAWLVVIVIGFVTFVYVTETDPGIILLVASLIGTTASFAFTDLLQQWLSQGRIAFDSHLKIGDLITTGDYKGYVREITSSSLVLETSERELVIIPASQVVESELMNHTDIEGAPVYVRFPVYAPGVARWRIKKALYEVALACQYRLEGDEFDPEIHHKVDGCEVWTIKLYVVDSFSTDVEETEISMMGTDRLESMGVFVGQVNFEMGMGE
ncbi:MAG: mechanosensitive ion channel domain-containing protein [Chloroflexota bacterium]